MKPPKMVIHSLDAKLVLNICIPANVSTVNVDANRNEVNDGRAVNQARKTVSASNLNLTTTETNTFTTNPCSKEYQPNERGQLSCFPQFFTG